MSALSDNRIPVSRLDELASLDDGEILEGYSDGFKGEPCGDNRSRSYWHGWRNGMVDSGRAKTDAAAMELVHEYVNRPDKRPSWRAPHD